MTAEAILGAVEQGDRGPSARSGSNVLYLSYDGLTDPLGRSQILPYLVGLSARGHSITVISFEKAQRTADQRQAVQEICDNAGIDWRAETYHGRPPILSTLYDVGRMARTTKRLHREKSFDLIHCRSYVTALIGLRMKRRHGLRFIFDMRGFWVDERIIMGLWRVGNPIYDLIIAFFRKREAEFLQEADAVVSLTKAGADKLEGRTRTRPTVIPCCVDFHHFRLRSAAEKAAARLSLGIPVDVPVLAYLGSIGDRMLVAEMLEAFAIFLAQQPGARFLVIAADGEQYLRGRAAALGIDQGRILFRSCRREEVPAAVGAADRGIVFYRPSEAMAGCSPTKLGEMLALGMPVLINSGIGDVDLIMADIGAGVVARSLDSQQLRQAVRDLQEVQKEPEEIRAAALRWFDLEAGIAAYDALYRSVSSAG